MHKIPVAVIGSGWVVENRHIPALLSSGRYQIVAIVGRKEEKLRALAAKFQIPSYYTGNVDAYDEWLPVVKAAVVGTDPLSHYDVISYCLERGKHVLTEKPFTTKLEHSKKLVHMAKKNDLHIGIVHNFQFSHAAKMLDEDISRGHIGAIQGVMGLQSGNPSRRLPVWYEKLPWGLFFDESPHLLYLLDKYTQNARVSHVVRHRSTMGLKTPGQVYIAVRTRDKIPASLTMNFEAPISEWFFSVLGERGMGTIDIFRDIYTYVPNDHVHAPYDILRTSMYTIGSYLSGTLRSGINVLRGQYLCGNVDVVTRFADAITRGHDLSPISATDALRINTLQMDIMKKAVVVR